MTSDQDELKRAILRIEELEEIISILHYCYRWDREEYQTNKDLVAKVEAAYKKVRHRTQEPRKS